MFNAIVFLAQLTVVQPQLEPIVMPLDATTEAVITQDAAGRPIRAVIRRIDGKPMTCDTFAAWFAQNYTCTGNCGNTFSVYGFGTANGSRLEACENAKRDACADATCGSGSYGYCSLIHSYSGVESTDCNYHRFTDCIVADDCTVE